MGLACSGEGIGKLLGALPASAEPVSVSAAAAHASSPSGAPFCQEYKTFLKEVSKSSKWQRRRQLWEAQGGWKVGTAGGCIGLMNMRNTCWLNSGLQCLLHLRPLVERILSKASALETPNGKAEAERREGPRIAQALQELLLIVWQNEDMVLGQSVAPAKVRNALAHYAPWLVQRNLQQDAQEFLAFMLDALHEELKIVAKPTTDLEEFYERLLKNDDNREEYEALWAWALHLQNAESPIVDIFQGQLRSLLTCQECGYSTRTFDPFLHLSVPVKPGECLLTDALKDFAAEEHLSDDNKWACDRCLRRVDATKCMELYKLPPVVMLHLKRFSYDARSDRVQKVPARVMLPTGSVEVPINLEPYTVSRQRGHAVYDIIGIVNHHGSNANGGHYTAHCFHCVEGEWYSFDDGKVNRIAASEVWLPECAYVLFLMKRLITEESQYLKLLTAKSPVKTHSFHRHVRVSVQTVDAPEHWPYMCNLVGIRRQLQLFNYMPSNIDLEQLNEYRTAYQRFRKGSAFGANGELLTSLSDITGVEPGKTPVATASGGQELPPPLNVLSYSSMSPDELAAFRTEYQRWRMQRL